MTQLQATALSAALFVAAAHGQVPEAPKIDIRGDRLADAEKMTAIWLYPEDHVNQTMRLSKFLFEAENFELHPDTNGYLFSFEPVIYGRLMDHPHIGNCNRVSPLKLNFWCSTAQGERIRKLFKNGGGQYAMPAEVNLKIEKRDNGYFAALLSFTSSLETNADEK